MIPGASRPQWTGPEKQQQMIEGAPGFRDQRTDLEPGSPFNHLPLQLQFFMSFMSFMLFMPFLFRLLGKPAHHRSSVRHDKASMHSGSFLPFVPFLPFQFRLLESQSNIGAQPDHDQGTRPLACP